MINTISIQSEGNDMTFGFNLLDISLAILVLTICTLDAVYIYLLYKDVKHSRFLKKQWREENDTTR